MKPTKKTLRTVIVLTLTFFFWSCAMVDLPLDDSYRRILQQRRPEEHLVGTISVLTGTEQALTPPVNTDFRPLSTVRVSTPESQAANRKHPTAEQIDLLLAEASRQFPNDQVELRNPTSGNQRTGSRQVGLQGQQQTQALYRRELRAEVVSTHPLPAPVNHSSQISGTMTRADAYRRAHNFLTDAGDQAIVIEQANIDLGRIRATYTFNVTSGLSYRISTTFTLDAHDSQVEISFANATMAGNAPILLQSVADLARTEIVRFSDTLISTVTGR
jgi:hypothetical protein